ncbi:MAG: hypothetical protein AB1696_04915 [Planctomycetota bacterium]
MRQYLLVAVAFLCMSAGNLSAQEKEKPKTTVGTVLRDGRAAMAAGNRENACAIYRRGADEIEGYGRQVVLRELARMLLAMDKDDEAIGVYEKLLTEQKAPHERERVLRELAGALEGMGKHEKAIEMHQSLMAEYTVRDPRRYDALGAILRIAHQAGKAKEYRDKARDDLNNALRQNLAKEDREELTWRTGMQLGDSSFMANEYEQAAKDYTAALPHAPESARYRIQKQLLLCYEQLKDYEGVIRACTALTAASHARTGSPYAKKLAQAYFMLGKDAEGMEAIANADPYTAASIAESMTTAGEFAASEKVLNRSLEKSPDNIQLLCALARLNWYRDRCDEALRIYRTCYARTPLDDPMFFKIAESIAGIYIDKKNVDAAAAAERKHLDKTPPQKNHEAGNQDDLIRELLLTALMEHDADDYANALRHLMELDSITAGHARLSSNVRGQIVETALAAVGDLLARGDLDGAEKALAALRNNHYQSLACDYAEYVILERRGKTEAAAEKLRSIRQEPRVPTTLRLGPQTLGPGFLPRMASERDHWTAATFLAQIGMMDLAVEEWKRTIEGSPRQTNADKMAAVCLGEYYADKNMPQQALEWFEQARDVLEQGISPRYSAYWRGRELQARFELAGDDPDVVAQFLRDNSLSYRLAAMDLLKDVGTPAHIAMINTTAQVMPSDLRAAADAAVLGIQSRFHRQLQMGLPTFDETKLKRTLSRKVNVLWIKPDEAEPSLRWIGLKDGFVLLADLKHQALYDFSDALDLLTDSAPSPTCIAFSTAAVWVGTEQGIFAYDRKSREWSQYAVMGKFLDIAIENVERVGRDWAVTVQGQGRFLFITADRTWRKLSE